MSDFPIAYSDHTKEKQFRHFFKAAVGIFTAFIFCFHLLMSRSHFDLRYFWCFDSAVSLLIVAPFRLGTRWTSQAFSWNLLHFCCGFIWSKFTWRDSEIKGKNVNLKFLCQKHWWNSLTVECMWFSQRITDFEIGIGIIPTILWFSFCFPENICIEFWWKFHIFSFSLQCIAVRLIWLAFGIFLSSNLSTLSWGKGLCVFRVELLFISLRYLCMFDVICKMCFLLYIEYFVIFSRCGKIDKLVQLFGVARDSLVDSSAKACIGIATIFSQAHPSTGGLMGQSTHGVVRRDEVRHLAFQISLWVMKNWCKSEILKSYKNSNIYFSSFVSSEEKWDFLKFEKLHLHKGNIPHIRTRRNVSHSFRELSIIFPEKKGNWLIQSFW